MEHQKFSHFGKFRMNNRIEKNIFWISSQFIPIIIETIKQLKKLILLQKFSLFWNIENSDILGSFKWTTGGTLWIEKKYFLNFISFHSNNHQNYWTTQEIDFTAIIFTFFEHRKLIVHLNHPKMSKFSMFQKCPNFSCLKKVKITTVKSVSWVVQ